MPNFSATNMSEIARSVSHAISAGKHPHPGPAVLVVLCCVKSDVAGRVFLGPICRNMEGFVSSLRIIGFPAVISNYAQGSHQNELTNEICSSEETYFLDDDQLVELDGAIEILKTIATDRNSRAKLRDVINQLGMMR